MSTDAAEAVDGEAAAVDVTRETAGGIRTWLDQTRAFAGQSINKFRNSPAIIGAAVGFPALMYTLSILMISPEPGVRAAMAVSWGVFGALFVCLFVFGSHLVTDLEDQRYVTFRSMPVHPSAEFAGRALAGLAIATAAMLSGVTAGVIDGAPLTLRGASSLAVVPLSFALFCLLFMMAVPPVVVVVENEQYANFITNLVVILAFFFTGQNGISPQSAFVDPSWLNYLPNSLATRLFAYHLVPADQWAEAGLTPPPMPGDLVFLGFVALYGLAALVFGSVFFLVVLYKLEGSS